ncbi:MAG: SUMF1/EgtB/PvdO family nonheme iron enzyme [Candidatus Cloacimonetes bacterium]|nr:SUMF1/EgtB/PvdO family nonheme iron enzyme [Candidatus Cloacimonadota bacterium]
MKRLFLLLFLLGFMLLLCAQNVELILVEPSNTGSIKVLSKFGGELYLDGEFYQNLFVGATAKWNDIPSGVHDVELKNTKGEFKRTINVAVSEESVVDFDAPAPVIPVVPETLEPNKEEEPPSPAYPKIAPLKNSYSFGYGILEIDSGVDGDIYLGGEYLGTVKADKIKRFKKLPAGEYSVELFSHNNCLRQDTVIDSKRTTSIAFSPANMNTYANGLLYVPEGSFYMGTQFIDRSEHERPRHEVSLSPFLIGATEVSQELWQSVMHSNPSVRTEFQQPVTNVSWYEALEFCNCLSLREGLTPCYKITKDFPDANNTSEYDTLRYSVFCTWSATGYRLPTEAEWEYAARCGDSNNRLQFSGGNKLSEVGWCATNSNNRTKNVAQKKANQFGLYDMSGNVLEWCWDYHGAYNSEPEENPTGVKSGLYRVIRGGSWMSDADACTSTARGGNAAHASAKDIGFRLVRSARAY